MTTESAGKYRAPRLSVEEIEAFKALGDFGEFRVIRQARTVVASGERG